MPAKKRTKPETLIPRDRLLNNYDVLTMDGLATLINVDVRTLRNRKPNKLPPYSKVGAERLFFKPDVVAWMRKSMNR